SPGWLRYALLDAGGRGPDRQRGIVAPYHQTLAEQPELVPLLCPDEPPIPGATELRRSLFTLPTHGLLTSRDTDASIHWIRHPNAA
ncbi:MAG TPA: hypothetical protein VGI97_05820, partial [Gemmatimonadaceae bacterium]